MFQKTLQGISETFTGCFRTLYMVFQNTFQGVSGHFQDVSVHSTLYRMFQNILHGVSEHFTGCFRTLYIIQQGVPRMFNTGSREFNGSVNIPESYDFRSQLLLLNIIFQPSFLSMF